MRSYYPIVLLSFLCAMAVPAMGWASLIVGVVTPDGIVVAADSRLNRVTAEGDHQVISDQEMKIVIARSQFAVAMSGKNRIGGRPVWGLVQSIPNDNLEAFLDQLAAQLSELHKQETAHMENPPTITIFVAGYLDGVGRLSEVRIPEGKVTTLHTTDRPGMAWAGDGGVILDRLILGADRRSLDDAERSDGDRKKLRQWEFMFPLADVSLADGVDLAKLMVRTSIEWSAAIKGTLTEPEKFHPTVGGPIDVAVVRSGHAKWVEQKGAYSLYGK